MKELKKPTNRNFWVVSSNDGSVMHHGQTEPNQETVTGLDNLEYTEDENTHLSNLASFTDKLPSLPIEGEEVEEGQIYNDNGSPVKCRQSHTRTHHDVKDIPALFIRVPDPDNIPEWSSFASHEFQAMEIGSRVTDEGSTYELTNPAQGHRKPSGEFGHHGWSEVANE